MRLGVERGDRVAVLSHNRAEIGELWIGPEQWGLVRVFMHTHFEMAVHARTLNDVSAAVLFFDTGFTDAVDAHRAEMRSVRLLWPSVRMYPLGQLATKP